MFQVHLVSKQLMLPIKKKLSGVLPPVPLTLTVEEPSQAKLSLISRLLF